MLVLLIGLLLSLAVVLLKAKTNNFLTPWKEALKGNLVKFLSSEFLVSIFVWYYSSKIGLLNPSSNNFTNFTLSWLHKVTIGTYYFVFVILKLMLAIVGFTQSLIQSNLGWILQLINGIPKYLPKLLKYFSGTAIFTYLNNPLPPVTVDTPRKLDCI